MTDAARSPGDAPSGSLPDRAQHLAVWLVDLARPSILGAGPGPPARLGA